MIVSAHSAYGLGSGGSSIVGAAGGAAGTIVGALPTLLPSLGIAGPVGLAIGGLIAAGAAIASALGVGNGCGQTCIQATNIVNQAEPTFKQLVDAYESGQVSQSQALQAYAQMQTAVEQACGQIPGAAGTNCVSDRFTVGGCKWKATSQPYPSSPAVGSCWNWDSGYRIPLTQPSVTPMQTTGSAVGDVTGTISNLVGGLSTTELLIGAGVVVALMAANG